ncbi:hypothetical protein DFH06DRAFT_1299195 [Mycena polygramma]|nr:hypothetical protein DFH06DRAFT_1299195 [Mycena polygramma]
MIRHVNRNGVIWQRSNVCLHPFQDDDSYAPQVTLKTFLTCAFRTTSEDASKMSRIPLFPCRKNPAVAPLQIQSFKPTPGFSPLSLVATPGHPWLRAAVIVMRVIGFPSGFRRQWGSKSCRKALSFLPFKRKHNMAAARSPAFQAVRPSLVHTVSKTYSARSVYNGSSYGAIKAMWATYISIASGFFPDDCSSFLRIKVESTPPATLSDMLSCSTLYVIPEGLTNVRTNFRVILAGRLTSKQSDAGKLALVHGVLGMHAKRAFLPGATDMNVEMINKQLILHGLRGIGSVSKRLLMIHEGCLKAKTNYFFSLHMNIDYNLIGRTDARVFDGYVDSVRAVAALLEVEMPHCISVRRIYDDDIASLVDLTLQMGRRETAGHWFMLVPSGPKGRDGQLEVSEVAFLADGHGGENKGRRAVTALPLVGKETQLFPAIYRLVAGDPLVWVLGKVA